MRSAGPQPTPPAAGGSGPHNEWKIAPGGETTSGAQTRTALRYGNHEVLLTATGFGTILLQKFGERMASGRQLPMASPEWATAVHFGYHMTPTLSWSPRPGESSSGIFPNQYLSQEFGFGDTELAVVAELKGYKIGWG